MKHTKLSNHFPIKKNATRNSPRNLLPGRLLLLNGSPKEIFGHLAKSSFYQVGKTAKQERYLIIGFSKKVCLFIYQSLLACGVPENNIAYVCYSSSVFYDAEEIYGEYCGNTALHAENIILAGSWHYNSQYHQYISSDYGEHFKQAKRCVFYSAYRMKNIERTLAENWCSAYLWETCSVMNSAFHYFWFIRDKSFVDEGVSPI